MSLASAVVAALSAGLLLVVTALGLRTTPGDMTALLGQPGRLLRSLLSMLVVMPVAAAILVRNLGLDPAVKIALVSLALSPVPPFLPPGRSRWAPMPPLPSAC